MDGLDWLSLFLDLCPGIGETKAILELIAGIDLITGEELNSFDRATCAISIIPAAGWLAKIPKSSKAAKSISKFEKFLNLVEKANKTNDVVDKFNLIRLILEDSGYNTCAKKLDPSLLIRALIPVKKGKYIVHSTINDKYVWDIDISSSNLQVQEKHGGLNQQFIFEPDIFGIYKIYCVQNGKALDCAFSSRDNGANVWAYEFNDTSAQHWILHSAGQNFLPFHFKFTCFTQIDYLTTKRCIDLKYSKAENGSNIWLYENNGTNAQIWYLEPVY